MPDGDLFGSAEHDPGGKVRLRLPPDVLSSAFYSPGPERIYRYLLERRWAGATAFATYVLWIMLNPSTATELVNDPTVGRCMSFTNRWGFRRLVVANLFGFRATKPRGLLKVEDPVGPDNDDAIRRAATDPLCAMTVFGWGAAPPGRLGKLVAARAREVRLLTGGLAHCLGTAADGHPRHPLFVLGDTPPAFWSPP